jgi:hypothetical protein
MRVWGLGFEVQGSGFGVEGSVFRVQGLVVRVEGSGLSFECWELRVRGTSCGV